MLCKTQPQEEKEEIELFNLLYFISEKTSKTTVLAGIIFFNQVFKRFKFISLTFALFTC